MIDINQTAKSLPHYHIGHTLYQGHPSDLTGRLVKKVCTYDLLDFLGVSYTRMDYDALLTVEARLEVDRLLDSEIYKSLFLHSVQEMNSYLLPMPGNRKSKIALLSRQIRNARLSFGEPKSMEEFMDLTPGSAIVMGLTNDEAGRVRFLIDKGILDGESLGYHPCISTSSLTFPVRDLIDKILPAMDRLYTMMDLPCTGWPICVI